MVSEVSMELCMLMRLRMGWNWTREREPIHFKREEEEEKVIRERLIRKTDEENGRIRRGVVRMKHSSLHSPCYLITRTDERVQGMKIRILIVAAQIQREGPKGTSEYETSLRSGRLTME